VSHHQDAAHHPRLSKRVQKRVLALGALAAAVLALVGLWDRFFPTDVADVATITSVKVKKQASLKTFSAGIPTQDVHLSPRPQAAATPADGRVQLIHYQLPLHAAAPRRAPSTSAAPTRDPSSPDIAAPEPTSSASPSESASTTVAPTDTPTTPPGSDGATSGTFPAG